MKSILLSFALELMFLNPSAHAVSNGLRVYKDDPIAKNTVALVIRKKDNSLKICTGIITSSSTVIAATYCLGTSVTIVFATDMDHPELGNKVAAKKFTKTQDRVTFNFNDGLPTGYEAALFLSDASVKSLLSPNRIVQIAGYGKSKEEYEVPNSVDRITPLKRGSMKFLHFDDHQQFSMSRTEDGDQIIEDGDGY